MRSHRAVLIAAAVLAGLRLVCTVPALAQSSFAGDASTGFRGAVLDIGTGEAIAGAVLSYVGPSAADSPTLTTDTNGAFEAAGLEAGPYVLDVTADGYRPRFSLAVTVVAGAMSPVEVPMRRTPSFVSTLARHGVVHAWVASFLTMAALLAIYRKGRQTPAGPRPSPVVAVGVGVVAGTAVGYSLAVLADTFVHHIGLEALTPIPRRPDLWWARNTATQLISFVGGFTGAILGVAAGLAGRQGRSVAQCASATAIGGAAAGMVMALSKSPSSASGLRRLLSMMEEPTSGQMWVMYLAIAIAIGGSALVGALIGLCVGAGVGFVARKRGAAAVER